MDGDISYLPYQPPFSDLEHAQVGGGGGATSSNFVNGHPYDLIDEVPVTSFKPVSTNSHAKGGAVHYDGARVPGGYPSIDRAYYYKVDGSRVITQSYWGSNIDVYFQTEVKSNEASIWGYGPSGNYNFKQLVDASKAEYKIWDGAGKHCDIKVSSTESSVWCGTNNSDVSMKAEPGKASLKVWNSDTYITLDTNDLSDSNHKDAKFRKAKVCVDGQDMTAYVLMTEPKPVP